MNKRDKEINKNKKEIDKNINAVIEKRIENAFQKSNIKYKKVK
jgi:hypothetical protein